MPVSKALCTATVFLGLAATLVASWVIEAPLPNSIGHLGPMPLILAVGIPLVLLVVAAMLADGLWAGASAICSWLRAKRTGGKDA